MFRVCGLNNKLDGSENNLFKVFDLLQQKIFIDEDKDIIVVDKPTNLLTISNENEKELTLFRLVSEHIKKENKKNRLFVVHRLDKDTSGVVLFSKNLKLNLSSLLPWVLCLILVF